ncbi:MAG: DUF503 domain-containing protein [Myxococcales bacterium]|nr:DUF503 domain-containing protein [Myxococcales bacterium]
MTIGAIRITLLLHGCFSLKEKRARIRPILERVKNKFHVAGAEVEYQNTHDAAQLAFVLVSSDERLVNRTLDQIVDFVESLGLAQIADSESEMMQW